MDTQLVLLDCTLRDGGYYNLWDFSEELVREYLDAIGDSGVDVVELGLRSRKAGGFKGMFAYCPEDHLATLSIPDHLKIGVMVNASELLSEGNISGALEELFPLPATESRVDLVRIAYHLHEVSDGLSAISWLKDRGYQVGINLMQISAATHNQITDLARMFESEPPDVLYFADSLGSMKPKSVADIIRSIRKGWSGPIGIHTHDSMGMALQNTLMAIDEGATWLDATVTGMGRGPGNAKTEELAIEVAERRSDNRLLVPLFRLAADYFQPLQNKYKWGTNPYYFLAGKYSIHPTYIQEMLGDSRYDETDVLSVINYLRRVGGMKFSFNTLDTARSFYQGEAKGKWHPGKIFSGKQVLILGAGPGVRDHSSALETFILKHRPLVLALNTQSSISDNLIDYRVACHPIRLLADAGAHSRGTQSVIMPYSMLPGDVQDSYDSKRVLDFGLSVENGKFSFSDMHCILPLPLVAAYALAVASSGNAHSVLMAGFDGYGADDPRSEEMQSIFEKYEKTSGACPILAVTPTRYKIPLTSIYLL